MLVLTVTLMLVALSGGAVIIAVFRSYARAGSLSDAEAKTFSWPGLILSSILGLYLELLLIRWISSEIRIFAYFKNFVLIACFLGFGIGCYLCRRNTRVAALLAPLVFLTFLVAVPIKPIRQLVIALPTLLGSTSDVHIWGVAQYVTPSQVTDLLLAAIIILPLFALISITFVPLGQLVGRYLESAPNGIAAYTANVLASLFGIALYTALCFLDQPPAVWFAIGGVLAAALFWPQKKSLSVALVFGLCTASLWFTSTHGAKTLWSPYQKLSLIPTEWDGEASGYTLRTNGSWYQRIIDLSPAFVARHPKLFRDNPVELNAYNIPYRFAQHPRSVLILGSGMGNDVAAALRNGAEHVTAVEIDPLILDLGRKYHPEHPYSSPRVKTVLADARNYIQTSEERFDTIVFSLLDSHTTASHFSNIRIDNYVYTREAMQAARKLLTPGGTFIVKFQVETPWIAGRLNRMLTEVFGVAPFQLQSDQYAYSTGGRFFIICPPRAAAAALSDRAFRDLVIEGRLLIRMEPAPITTDDWPYFYQHERGLPPSVLAISFLLVIASIVAARSIGLRVASIRWEFFFLGAGFMLLEAQIISRMALLFGTTWIVNSIFIAVLLLLIVAANIVTARFPDMGFEWAYVAIVLSIAASAVVPLKAFFFESFVLRAVLATLFFCMPAFFAGIVFIRRFAAAGFSGDAIGANLLGSLAGGIAESISLWLGLRSLLLIAAIFYVGAWLASKRSATTLPAPAAASA